MNRQPTWVWKQRAALGRFMISFYVRRSLNIVRGSLPSLPRFLKSGTKVKPLPRRHPRTVKIAQPDESQRADS
jgi:hypothetical protein